VEEKKGRPGRRNQRRPSFEDGRLRDSEVERLQDPSFDAEDLKRTIQKAVKRGRPKSS
jgi:hypothetical protein